MAIRSTHGIDTTMKIATISFFVIFALFAISTMLIPKVGGGWHNPPIFDYIAILAAGIYISIISGTYGYFVWFRDSRDFIIWYSRQLTKVPKWAQHGAHADMFTVWLFRLLAPIGLLIGLAVFGLGLVFSINFWTS